MGVAVHAPKLNSSTQATIINLREEPQSGKIAYNVGALTQMGYLMLVLPGRKAPLKERNII